MKLTNLKIRGTFQGVQFSGSSTHAAALQNWIDTGEYKQPGIATQDIRVAALKLPNDSALVIEPGNYLILLQTDGTNDFNVLDSEDYVEMFEVIPD